MNAKQSKKNIYEATLNEVGKDAHLTSNKLPVSMNKEVRAKHLKAVPVQYFNAHAKLVNGNGTSLDFTSYILEALREKLERDKAL